MLSTWHSLALIFPAAKRDRDDNLRFPMRDLMPRETQWFTYVWSLGVTRAPNPVYGSRRPLAPWPPAQLQPRCCPSACVSWQLCTSDLKSFIFYCLPIWAMKKPKERISFFSTYYSHMFIPSSPLECKLQPPWVFPPTRIQVHNRHSVTPPQIKTFSSFQHWNEDRANPYKSRKSVSSQDN